MMSYRPINTYIRMHPELSYIAKIKQIEEYGRKALGDLTWTELEARLSSVYAAVARAKLAK